MLASRRSIGVGVALLAFVGLLFAVHDSRRPVWLLWTWRLIVPATILWVGAFFWGRSHPPAGMTSRGFRIQRAWIVIIIALFGGFALAVGERATRPLVIGVAIALVGAVLGLALSSPPVQSQRIPPGTVSIQGSTKSLRLRVAMFGTVAILAGVGAFAIATTHDSYWPQQAAMTAFISILVAAWWACFLKKS